MEEQTKIAIYGNFAGYRIRTLQIGNGPYMVEARLGDEPTASIRMDGFPTFFGAVTAMKREIVKVWSKDL